MSARWVHPIARDSWGYYCLTCSWPDGDFCGNPDLARAHRAEGGER